MKIIRFSLLPTVVASLAVVLNSVAQPVFLGQPESRSVSLGADVFFYAPAYSPFPVSYQWYRNGAALPEQTGEMLILSPVQAGDAGDYCVVAADTTGAVTSQVATVTVDLAFTKVTTGPIVNDLGLAWGGCWGDYDQDGYLDLYVPHDGGVNNALFHNNGDGTFTAFTEGRIVNDGGASFGAAWGDADNDGCLDLVVANFNDQSEFFYRNNGDGTFTAVTNAAFVRDRGYTIGGVWADFDNDGWLDLFFSNYPASGSSTNYLYRNLGAGSFMPISNAPGTADGGYLTSPICADFNNDGRIDLLISRLGMQTELLFRNQGSNTFTRLPDTVLNSDQAHTMCAAWGDYDNDGHLDLFVAHGFTIASQPSALYHNNGDGSFTKITNGPIASALGWAGGAGWADYDNDGFLDLFVTDTSGNNLLYHNEGDGSFASIRIGSVVNEGGISFGCAWGDYNNDGFPDLFVANQDQGHFLYRNSGNSNAWLKVRCVGRFSNRIGLGTKVRVLAGLGGTNRWQLREITGGAMMGSQSLEADFGLGDATHAATVRLEWPSGIMEELADMPARQILTVVEPPYRVWPPNPGAALGEPFVLSIVGVDDPQASLQWQLNGVALAGATNTTLPLLAVTTNDLGSYTVAVRCGAGGPFVITAPAGLHVAIPPGFKSHPLPTNQMVSAGVTITYQVSVTGSDPTSLQWRQNGVDLPGATNTALVLTNVNALHAGAYTIVARNYGGAVTSQVAVLNVDATFTKVIQGCAVSDGGASVGAAWLENADFAGLLVANGAGQNEFFYQADAAGTFTRVPESTAGTVVADGGDSGGLALGDYDNDGRLDLFVANAGGQNNFLYHNDGAGRFSRLTAGSVVNDGGNSLSAAWADFDRDGFLDLVVANLGNDFVYRNNGDGTFARVTNTVLATDGGNSRACAWADFDNDGDPDLFVANNGYNFLYRNQGQGVFARVTTGSIATDGGTANACAWGDYDNDGDLDLFVARHSADLLYRNNGDGTFAKITTVGPAKDGGTSYACAWVDYDNDGWLDLYVANNGVDFLYHNNADGTFARVTTGSPSNDGGDSRGCVWGDFNRDGFPDLFVANLNQDNFVYLNNGNSNRWLKVRCDGTASNRAGIGAKVRVLAELGGTPRWQMREITSGDGLGSQGLTALFGLGQATQALTVRVEWPSGATQEFPAVAANQCLTLTEPPCLSAPALSNHVWQCQLIGGAGLVYTVETSTNLVDWVPWLTVTNAARTMPIIHPELTGVDRLFFRAVVR